jgi:hypothetical protein
MNKQVPDQAPPPEPDGLASGFALLFEAITDAFRGLTPGATIDSRWSRLRACGRSFGPQC